MLRRVIYQYYCEDCSRFYKYELDFDDRLKEYACQKCFKKLKYKGGTDAAVASNGNCNYRSAERESEINIKNMGHDEYQQMQESDQIYQYRQKSREESKTLWYRKFLKDPTKPLPLSKVKDVQKFIDTGEM